MAVVSTPKTSNLRIIVEIGEDENGRAIHRTRSYNVKTNAEDEDLMSVAVQLAEIQVHDVESIRRVTESELVEVEE